MGYSRLNIGRNGEKKQAREIEYLFAETQWFFRWLIPSLRDPPPAAQSSGSSSRVQSRDSLPNHVFQGSYSLFRVRSHGVVSVDFRVSDDAISIDDQSSWEREGPGIVSIVFFQINVELQKHFLEIFRGFELEAIALCHLVFGIAQDFKSQLLLFSELPIE